jgi:uncharacterized protein YjeT (DUF2065 family)
MQDPQVPVADDGGADLWPYNEAPAGRRKKVREPVKAPPKPPRSDDLRPYGICLSGGGIRSASVCMGALQAMQRRCMLIGEPRDRASFLSAVSGGSYITGAYALLAHQLEQPETPMREVPPFHRPLPLTDAPNTEQCIGGGGATPTPHLFPPGTPEELHLRDHSLYLSHGLGGSPGALWHLTLGIMLNLAVLVLAIDALARPVGWLAQRVYGSSISLGLSNQVRSIPTKGYWWVVIGLAGAAVFFGLISLLFPTRWRWRATWAERLSHYALILAGIAAVVVGLPYIFVWLRGLFGYAPSTPVSDTANRLKVVAGAGGGLSLLTGLSQIRRLWARKPKIPGVDSSKLLGFASRHKSMAMNLVAYLAGPLLIFGTFLASAFSAAARAKTSLPSDVRYWAIATAVLVFLWAIGNLNNWSPHSYYYDRLASVFTVGRQFVGEKDPRLSDEPFDPSATIPWPPGPGGKPVAVRPWKLTNNELALQQFQAEEFPEVLICAAANVRDYGFIPTGFNVSSFVFSKRLVGGPLVGAVSTGKYEDCLGGRTINLPEAVSIAGAAVAPSMGKMSRAPLRFLMTLANVRLGVWIVNPRRLESFGPKGSRLKFPRVQYLFHEMFGLNGLDSRYLYVTDGGHYENLGLVEQLRRGCEWIFCIDAAGDTVTTFHTLGEAIALARAELDVDIRITPDVDMALPADQAGQKVADLGHVPWVTKAHAFGDILYPDGTTGRLVYIKAAVPEDAPWDIKNYAETHPGFPTDPTLDQFFDATRIDAYRTLGELITEEALNDCWKDFSGWKDNRDPGQSSNP